MNAPFDPAARRMAIFHADAGIFEQSPLSSDCSMLGGRALAETLAARLPAGPALVFAPGLLSFGRRLPASRCCVASRPDGSGAFAFASAGGAASRVLSGMGIAALILCGASRRGQLQDLAIGAEGMRLSPSRCAGTSVSAAFSCLGSSSPGSAAFAVAGPAAELDLPIASLALGSRGSHAVSRAGGGAGQALCRMGLKALLLDAPEREPADAHPLDWEDDLMRFFAGSSAASSRCTGCTPWCAVRPVASAEDGVSLGKWPGYVQTWSAGDREQDRANVRRYANFCDEFGVDAFALAGALEDARRRGILTERTASQMLDDLDRLLDRPGSSPLPGLLHEMPLPARRRGHDPWKYLLDSLGICGFAAGVLDEGSARGAFLDAASAALGIDRDALTALCGGELP
ncbi:MAG: hypothetical protein IKS68_02310 [Mailhella sp.]|nr:hypothetical protein [Mailhella sp.]